jgi:FkbM family methyltransferase
MLRGTVKRAESARTGVHITLPAAHDPGVRDGREVEMPRMRISTRMVRSAYRRAVLRASEAYYGWRGWRAVSVGGARAKVRTESSYTRSEVRYFLLRETKVAGRFLDLLRSDDVVYDVGANVGIYTVLTGKVLDCGAIVAFEPFPPNREELERNLALNDSDAEVIGVALDDDADEAPFTSPSGREAGCGIASIQRDDSGEFVVETAPADALVGDEVPPPDAVKIDVEGAELRVLEGMDDALSGVRCLLCEVHLPSDHRPSIESFGGSKAELEEYLRSRGFSVSTIAEGRHEDYVLAEA